MYVNYQLDELQKSEWLITTPTTLSKKLPLYLNEWGHFISGKKYFTEREGQNNYLLFFTLAGKGLLTVKGQELTLIPHTAVLIDCNEYQHYATEQETGLWDYKWVHFNGEAASVYFSLINPSEIRLICLENPLHFDQMMTRLMRFFHINDIKSNVSANKVLTELLCDMITNGLAVHGQQKVKYLAEITLVMDYINDHYADKISLTQLAQIAHISKFYLLNLFKQHVGLTPYQYLLNLRINRSKEFLRNTDQPVSEISRLVGFDDESNFIKQFRTITGLTPLTFRKSI